jgi:hypothetical protein
MNHEALVHAPLVVGVLLVLGYVGKHLAQLVQITVGLEGRALPFKLGRVLRC